MKSTPDEELLIQRAKSGEVEAWEQLVVRYQGILQDHIRYRYDDCLSGHISVEDILQETLLQAWLDIKSLKRTAPTSFVAWLKAVANRRVSDALKAQQRLKRGGQLRRTANWIADGSASWQDLLDALPAEAQTASAILSEKENAQALQVAVDLLPEAQRTALTMHDLDGMTLRQTADAMKRTVAAVRGLLHRGRQQLAHDLASATSWLSSRADASRDFSDSESPAELPAIDEVERSVNYEPKDLVGQTISHYQVVEKLGAGGMGVVYQAKDTRLSRNVALKFLPDAVTLNSRAVERFTREARAASALNHPNIVTIYDIAEVGGLRFIVMELVEGQTLRTMSYQDVPMESLKEFGAQAARALAVAHATGIVHRDIKPKNVMVRDDGYVKVLDFGLARLMPDRKGALDEATHAEDTGPGVVLGTPRYMSPEQTKGATLGPATDVFSLGVVLYELATGRNPFDGESHQAVTCHIQSENPIPPSRLNPEVSGHFEHLILELLQKDPRLRPTAQEVEARLSSLTKGTPAEKSPGQESRGATTIERHSVGREEPLAALRSELATVRTGQGRVVCVAGEPGIGKTTLLDDFLEQVTAEENTLISGRGSCSERLAGTEAYLPILELLESLTRNDGGEFIARTLRLLAPTWFVRVVSLSTEDSSAERVLADARTASQERMKREMIAFLEELCSTRPTVLFLEDIHWADASSADLLAYIGTKLDTMPLLIVATYRPTELLLGDHVFARVKLELQARGRCREISLDFLTRKDVDKYLALEFPDHRFPVEFSDFIYKRTEGSPLFIIDLLRFLRDQRAIVQEQDRWELVKSVAEIEDQVPESVRSMVQKKIDRLTAGDRRLLTTASIQGHVFEAGVVARSLELDEAEVEERLDVLDRVYTLVRPLCEHEFPDNTLTVRYTFVHALYQNSLYATLTPARRARASAAVAAALVEFHGEQKTAIASELALLFEAARDFAQASDQFKIAARNAAALYAVQEAVELTQKAIANAERLQGEQSHELVLAAALQSGELNVALSRFGDAAADFRRAEQAAQELGDQKAEVNAICGLAKAQLLLKRLGDVVDQGRRALDLARAIGSKVSVANAEETLAQERLCVGAVPAAEEYLKRAAPVLESDGTPMQSIRAVSTIGSIHTFRLEYQEAHRTLDWAVERSRELGACFLTLKSLFFKSMVLGNQGCLSDAISTLREGIRLAELNGEQFWLSRLPNTLGWIHREAQDFETALRLDNENVSLAREMGFQEGEANSLVNLGHDYLSLGELDLAFGYFQEAANVYDQDVWYRWRYNTRLQAELARYWILRGSFEPAARHATACLQTAEATQSPKYIAWAHKVLGDIASLEDRVEDAKREYGIALQTVDAHPCPTTHWRILAARADLARKLKDTAAVEEFRGQARYVAQGLADSIREESLRQKFLTSDAIREL